MTSRKAGADIDVTCRIDVSADNDLNAVLRCHDEGLTGDIGSIVDPLDAQLLPTILYVIAHRGVSQPFRA